VASAGPNGSIAPAGSVVVNQGASQAFTITPDPTYHVADVLVDGVSVGAVTSYTFTNVTANHTIAASFAIDTWTIVASAGPNGSIAPAGSVVVNQGGSQAFTITPDPTYHVADVLVDGVSVGAVTSYTFTNVAANHTIAASFAIDTWTIVASAGPNGSIAPAGSVVVNQGGTQGVHDHTGSDLSRRGRAGGRRVGGRGGELHVHERAGEPHHRGLVRDRHVDHRGERGPERQHWRRAARWW